MSPTDDPTQPTPPESAIILPRPNLGPEPWSEPPPRWGPTELILGAVLILAAGVLAVWQRRLRQARRRAMAGGSAEAGPESGAEATPNHRLIASSQTVRAALIAAFGPAWSSRTTEEIARDPALVDRLGAESAQAVIAYLQRVDLAKFAGEEFSDVDEWITTAQTFVSQVARPGPPRNRPI